MNRLHRPRRGKVNDIGSSETSRIGTELASGKEVVIPALANVAEVAAKLEGVVPVDPADAVGIADGAGFPSLTIRVSQVETTKIAEWIKKIIGSIAKLIERAHTIDGTVITGEGGVNVVPAKIEIIDDVGFQDRGQVRFSPVAPIPPGKTSSWNGSGSTK